MTARVFIVDDQAVDQALLRQGFHRVGCEASIDVVPEAAVAIGMLETGPAPALLIVDLRLGLESGLELVEWVRRHGQLASLPIIMMSGSDDPAAVSSAYAAGANAFVVKPNGVDELDRLCRAIDDFWLRAAALPEIGHPS